MIFECTFIYGHPIFQQRRGLWPILARLHSGMDVPWCAVGDFNEMLASYEKVGLRLFEQRKEDLFREFLNSTGLMDMDLKGCEFAWASNPRDGVITRKN